MSRSQAPASEGGRGGGNSEHGDGSSVRAWTLYLFVVLTVPQLILTRHADPLDPGAIKVEPADRLNCQNMIVIESDDDDVEGNGTYAARSSVLYYDTSAEHDDGYDANNEENSDIDVSCFTSQGQYSLSVAIIEHDDGYNADEEDACDEL